MSAALQPLDARLCHIVVVRDPRGAAWYDQAAEVAHLRRWWPYRRLDNVLFVHLADLQRDPQTEVAVVAEYLGLVPQPDCAVFAAGPQHKAVPAAAVRRLPPDCAAYAEQGRRALW